MVGLDATLQARADKRVKERLAGLGRLGSDLLLPALAGYGGADDTTPRHLLPAVLAPGAGSGPAVHDVCALALVAEPALFGCQPARIGLAVAGRPPGRAGMPWACRQTGERDEEIDRIIRGHHGQLRHGGDHGGERVRGAGRSGPALLRDPVGDPAQGGRVHGADPGAERPRRAASLL
jgi:hypothetical protein